MDEVDEDDEEDEVEEEEEEEEDEEGDVEQVSHWCLPIPKPRPRLTPQTCALSTNEWSHLLNTPSPWWLDDPL